MDKTQKQNDIFAAVLQLPDANVYDLVNSEMNPENTQLLDKDFYKNSEIVKNTFVDSNNKFDEIAVDNAYNKAFSLYNEVINDEQYNVIPSLTKDINPFKNEYSRDSIGSITPSKLSIREIAQ